MQTSRWWKLSREQIKKQGLYEEFRYIRDQSEI